MPPREVLGGHRLDVGEGDARGQGGAERLLPRRCETVGALLEPVPPQPREHELGAELVELAERRVDTGLHRTLPEQPAGERVDGGDERRVDVVKSLLQRAALRGVERRAFVELLRSPSEQLLQARGETLTQVAGGLLREGDGDDLRERRAGSEAVDEALDQDARLAGPGAGLDQEGRVQFGHRPEAVRLVARLVHATPPSSGGPGTRAGGPTASGRP